MRDASAHATPQVPVLGPVLGPVLDAPIVERTMATITKFTGRSPASTPGDAAPGYSAEPRRGGAPPPPPGIPPPPSTPPPPLRDASDEPPPEYE
jgi:hypothetical protein